MRFVSGGIGDGPWIQLGDFNVVRRSDERLVGFDSSAACEFNDCLAHIGMDDMPYKGYWFTWSNRRAGLGEIRSKLDRVMINAGWLDSFPESEAIFESPGISDPSPMFVTVLPETHKKRPFKFFNFWMKHARFKEELGKSWCKPVTDHPKFFLLQKLKRLKPVLRSFNTSYFSHLSARVDTARQAPADVQLQLATLPQNQQLHDQEKGLLVSFIDLSYAEESFKIQKSRVLWLSLGDQNTKFFYQLIVLEIKFSVYRTVLGSDLILLLR